MLQQEKVTFVTSPPINDGESNSMKPAQLILTKDLDNTVRREVKSGCEQIKFTQLDMKVIDHGNGK